MAKKKPSASLAPRLSSWVAGSVNPIREGVYRRKSPAGPYTCWSGRHWYLDADSPARAATRVELSPHQAAPWRGVATPTAGPCFTCRGHTVIDRGYDAEGDADLIEEGPD